MRDSAESPGLPGVVIEDLDPTGNFTVSARNWADTNLHGDPVAMFMVKVNLRPTRTTTRYGTAERAVDITEQAPGVVDVHQDHVGTAGPYNFFGAVSGRYSAAWFQYVILRCRSVK